MTEFSGMYARILAELLRARREHKLLTLRDLCVAAYDGRWQDAPDNIAHLVQVSIQSYKGRLNYLGWSIATPSRTGKEGYYLVAIVPKGDFDKPIRNYDLKNPAKRRKNQKKPKRKKKTE